MGGSRGKRLPEEPSQLDPMDLRDVIIGPLVGETHRLRALYRRVSQLRGPDGTSLPPVVSQILSHVDNLRIALAQFDSGVDGILVDDPHIYLPDALDFLRAVVNGPLAPTAPAQLDQAITLIEASQSGPSTDSSVPVAQSASGRVLLYGRTTRPVVDENEKEVLGTARYDVVAALLNAGQRGLTKRSLDLTSGHGDSRKTLKRLADSDPDWKRVISFPGRPGRGYRIL